jgi:putative glutamine amidotransferase
MQESDALPPDLPRIAIAPRLFGGDPGAAGAWRQQQLFFECALLERITAAGALIVGSGLPAEPAQMRQIAAAYARHCDGLVLQGGTNIASSAGAFTLHDHARDRFELELVAAFCALDKPVLGICRGLQLLNVAFGGLVQPLPEAEAEHPSQPAIYAEHAHAVVFAAGGYLAGLYGTRHGVVSSAHRQTVRRLGDGLVVEATCPDDGRIEALRSSTHRHVLGVQWHPEFDRAPDSRLCGDRLLRDFVAQTRDG